MMSSAFPGMPVSVAKTTRWPLRVNIFQLTATSVGSKSRSGIGISTVAMTPWFQATFSSRPTLLSMPPRSLLKKLNTLPTMP